MRKGFISASIYLKSFEPQRFHKTLYAKNVVMLLSTSRRMRGGIADRAALPKGSNGRTLCRW
jgi:hypothetical protein